MEGLMMDYQLTLTPILERAKLIYPKKEIVSKLPELKGGLHRYTYADLHKRTLQLANVLKKLGIEPGDRVGTFAFNHYRHLELYYAVPCSGSVLHTLNIRLFPDQL
ncbi:MAG: AMP-binding protein, partial [Promethearchaeota archaeon]